jgi:hypothetical protein
MLFKRFCLFLIVLSALLVGCTETLSPTTWPESPLPKVVSPVATATPVPLTFTSPLMLSDHQFMLVTPLHSGDQQVTGQGPAGIPINIVDVTLMGFELGSTTIDESGTFSVQLLQPLEEGHRIGIMLGSLEDTDWTPDENLANELFELRGPDYMNIPRVGVVYDTAMVQE